FTGLPFRGSAKIALEFCLSGGSIRRHGASCRTTVGDVVSQARKLRDGEPVKPRSGAHAGASVALAAMRSQLAFMTGLANMATRCINASPAEIAAEIMDALRMIGEFFGADRSYILSFCDDERSMQYAYEWGTTGTVSVMAPLKGIPPSRYPWCVKTLKEAGMLNIAQLSQLPESAWAERALLQALGVRSFVAVPLSTGGVLSGCLGLSALQSEHRWDGATIALMRQATDVCGNVLLRALTLRRTTAK